MGRLQPTNVEALDSQHPGLRLFVDESLRKAGSTDPTTGGKIGLEWMSEQIREKYGVRIPIQTLSSYKKKRWEPERARMIELMERTEAIVSVVEKRGLTPVTHALIAEQLDDFWKRGEKLPGEILLREQRERWKLEIEQNKVKVAEQQVQLGRDELAVKVQQLEAQREKVKEIVGAVHEPPSGQAAFDPAEALAKISAVIGVGQAPEERVEAEN